ncbi:hypothetical protein ACVFYP_03095 [Roseomonas sp. F4]
MQDWSPAAATRWLAEAVETGNPLGELPPEIAPQDLEQAEAVALAVLEQLEIAPCGVRLLLRPGAAPLAGPMIEGRLVPKGATIALDALHHPRLTAAAIGVLAEPLQAGAPPVFAALHAAIDIAATRHAVDTDDELALTADLARLGLVVAGRGKRLVLGVVPASLGAAGVRRKAERHDLAEAFRQAADFALKLGGLPAGGLLVVAGLTPPIQAKGEVSVSLGPLGRVEAICA